METTPISTVADRYELLEPAGTGGMGTVYRARDLETGDEVALKVLHVARSDHLARFQRETQILRHLNHPGIVRYLADGVLPDGRSWLAMTWLDGITLAERLRAGPLPLADALAVTQRLAEALRALHQVDLVHRDIKPHNIFLVGARVTDLRLLDFGLARTLDATRVTATGAVVGTPSYMAPEQATGGAVDARSDVFAIGCVLYACLVGEPPFHSDRVLAILAKIVFEDAPTLRTRCPAASPGLERLLGELLAKDAALRPRDAGAVVDLLAALDEGREPVHGADDTVEGPAITTGERRFVSVVVRGAPEDGSGDATAATRTAAARPDVDVEHALARYGARLVALADGSRVAVLSGAFQRPTEQAVAAVQCAGVLREAEPGRPVAVATGWGDLGGALPVGDVVDRAVAMVHAPETGAFVRLDEATAGLVRSHFVVIDALPGVLAVDPRRRPVRQEGPSVLAPSRALLGRDTPCLGRDREVDLLMRQWQEARDEGAASAVLVVGGAGMGKSRLLAELWRRLEEAGAPPALLVARGDPLAGASPFALLAEALRRLAGLRGGDSAARRRERLARLVADVDPGERARVEAFLGELLGLPAPAPDREVIAARRDALLMGDQIRAAWLTWLEAQTRRAPLLVVVEDLHWGDAASVRLLDAALDALRDAPWMIVALARPELRERFGDRGLWPDRDVTELTLGPLRKRWARQLVLSALGDQVPERERLTEMVSLAEGNTFYLEELIRAHARGDVDRAPDSVLSMAQHRLAGLDVDARRVLRAASVLGRRFWLGAVEALTGTGDPAVARWLDALVHDEVLSRRADAGGRFEGQIEYLFRHDLLQEAAYAMLPEDDRRTGHRLAAEWLVCAGESDAARLALHLERGGELTVALERYGEAARDALARSDVAGADAHVEAAVRCGAAGLALGQLRGLQARVGYWLDDPELQHRAARAATTHLPEGSAEHLAATEQLVISLGRLHRARELEALGTTLLDATTPIAQVALARARARASIRLILVGHEDLAARLLAAVVAQTAASPLADPSARALVLQAQSVSAAHIDEDLEAASDFDERAATELRAAGDLRGLTDQLANLSYTYALAGQWADAASSAREARQLGERLQIPSVVGHANHNLGPALAGLGRLEEARVAEQAAVDWFGACADVRLDAGSRCYLADILMQLGRLGEARLVAASAVARLHEVPTLRAFALAVLADVELASGRAEAALASASAGMQIFEETGGLEHGELLLRVVHADALHRTGEQDEALDRLSEAAEILARQAAAFADPARRRAYVEAVPAHARIGRLRQSWGA